MATTATALALAGGIAVGVTATAQAAATDGVVWGRTPHAASDTSVSAMMMNHRANLTTGADRVAAAPATLTLASTATRVAGGAAATIAATYNCPGGHAGVVITGITEVTGEHVAQSFGQTPTALTCDGRNHTAPINVVVTNDYPLKAGTAFGQAFLVTCNADESSCADATAERTITVT